ncbi:rhomboid family intramembrane serine protease [Natrinema sp. 1APR25-10V2]|uniref:rhomboid family intramembrane serine protease n=1 Tax=Natrinema sp. 1APR25-10V2 TaxID=2951081 RepID=UPI0028760141|nr:rhomboid family intramembrane serine protease [Natrinema sp. 1APR25-10V2]MDS0475664.1 rhomboid family intramembrane serine protease [Natrinema sp. 1APR25-10V2]
MPITPTQAVLAGTVLVALGVVWYTAGRGRWRALAADRFVAGVPWGTGVTVAIVVAFYVVVQSDVQHVTDPVTLPFISWSYFYPLGLVTAGIAHGSLDHLAANMAGTLAFAPLVEYAWGHYPPAARTSDGGSGPRAPDGAGGRGLARPLARAVLVFPSALLGAAVLTSVFAIGAGLGFSGAVFAIVGVAVVTYPLPALVASIAASAMQTLSLALREPIVRETVAPAAPGPPAWAGIGFQAHLLGFLVGVLCGVVLVRRRGRRPATARLFFATLALGLVQALWLLVWIGDDVFVLYRGAGVVLVVGLALLVTVAITGSTRPLPRPLSVFPAAPTRRQLAIGWLALLAIALVAATVVAVTGGATPLGLTLGLLLGGGLVLALPALPAVVPDLIYAGPLTYRGVAIVLLVGLTVLVALPSVPLNLVVVEADAVPGDGGVAVGDYTVTYAENATPGHQLITEPEPDAVDAEAVPLESRQSGLLVVNEEREIWTVVERTAVLAHEGNATVEVGGLDWRESVHANRTGWDVVGNGSAYVVDLTVNGETTRAFVSAPVQSSATIDGRAIAVAPTADAFVLRVLTDGAVLGEAAIPDVNETTTVGAVDFVTEVVERDESPGNNDDRVRVVASVDDTEIPVAQRETYADATA